MAAIMTSSLAMQDTLVDVAVPPPQRRHLEITRKYVADDYKPFRSKHDAAMRRRAILTVLASALFLALLFAVCRLDARAQSVNRDVLASRLALTLPKPTTDKEGVEWRFEDVGDYLRATGLKFNEGPPAMSIESTELLRGNLQFENTGRNHWTFIVLEVMRNGGEARAHAEANPERSFAWGKFVFGYKDSPATKAVESRKHLAAIRAALE